MPLYTYQCRCGLRFEASVPMDRATEPHPCPDCGEDASRHLPEDVSGIYQQDVTGPVPQNTGLADLDAHIDRVIGKSAEQGWEVHRKRQEEKKRLLEKEKTTPDHLSRNPDGTYRILSDEEAGVHSRANALHSKVMEIREQVLKESK